MKEDKEKIAKIKTQINELKKQYIQVNKEMLSDCKKTSEILKPMKIRIKELEKELGIKKQKYEKKENQKTQI